MQVSEQSRPRCAEYADALAANARLATLHMVCGKIGSGKSTLARQLAAGPGTVLVSEDSWLAGLYPGEMQSVADYVRCSTRLKGLMGAHVQALLDAGVSVVLDFPANTLEGRGWARSVFEKVGAAHRLHFLDVPDEVCKQRLRVRNAAGEHPFQASDEQFDMITSYFVAPSDEEGFDVVHHPYAPL
ncbi:AAA family ATPase [Delftia acidovorans]|uniref:AAA family ATPase n=1 Tax=Delftia acidovorans TaxID=80866 RepID=UPI00333FE2D5